MSEEDQASRGSKIIATIALILLIGLMALLGAPNTATQPVSTPSEQQVPEDLSQEESFNRYLSTIHGATED